MQISKLFIAFLIGAILAVNPQCQPDFDFQASKKKVTKQPTTKRTASPKVDSIYAKVNKGKMLFRNNCASCHNKNMKDEMTGPALAGVEKRWSKYPKEDLYNYIRESQKMINNGHPQAQKVWKIWGPTIMSNFPNLKDEEIESILAYIDAVSRK